MSRSQIDLKVVWERLGHLRELLADLKRLPAASFEEFAAQWWNYPTAESLVRRSIESLFDVARHILSRHFGMGALEYREVAVAMAEKDLVRDQELAAQLVKIAGFRTRLTHFYKDVTPEELYKVVSQHLGDLEAASEELRAAAERLSGDEP